MFDFLSSSLSFLEHEIFAFAFDDNYEVSIWINVFIEILYCSLFHFDYQSIGSPHFMKHKMIFLHRSNLLLNTLISLYVTAKLYLLTHAINSLWQEHQISVDSCLLQRPGFSWYGMCWKIRCPKVCIDYAAIVLYF